MVGRNSPEVLIRESEAARYLITLEQMLQTAKERKSTLFVDVYGMTSTHFRPLFESRNHPRTTPYKWFQCLGACCIFPGVVREYHDL